MPRHRSGHHPHRSLLSLCFGFSVYKPSDPGVGLGGLDPPSAAPPLPFHRAFCAPSIPSVDLGGLAPPFLIPHGYHSAPVPTDDVVVKVYRAILPVDTFDPFSELKLSPGRFRPTTSPPDRSPAPGIAWLSGRPSSPHHPPLAPRHRPLSFSVLVFDPLF